MSEDEFQSLFEAQYLYVCRSLRRLGVGEADVPDVAQELFVIVHRELSTYDRARPIRPWLYAFVTRLAANYRKLRRHAYECSDEATSAPATIDADEITTTRDLVLRALDALDDDKRTALVLFDLEGFDGKEVAELIGVPMNTAYSRLRAARDVVRTFINQKKNGGEG